jgi:D-alanine-D-alanine ligase
MTALAERISMSNPTPGNVDKKLKITVLCGGPSAEREVSLKSGHAVANALKSLGHEVFISDIAPDSLAGLDVPADVVFIALHGTFGEDGQVQKILQSRGLRYTGSGPEASATAMDKVATKRKFIAAGVPTPRFEVVTTANLAVVTQQWQPPVVLKPIADGSSVDISIARDAATLGQTLSTLVHKHGQCLLEQFIDGIELTVGVFQDQALPPIQIRTKREFYNYEAKYLDNDTEYLFDIDLPADVLRRVQELSVKASQALGCRDFCRVDWMVEKRTLQAFALEVNTIPGFTDHSLLPKGAGRVGIGFAELCKRIVDAALAR